MANYYCEYCGVKYQSIQALAATTCGKHPNGSHKGRHKLYEGGEKSEYYCKYCGAKYQNIQALTATTCGKHPNGSHKGRHSPAL